MTARTIIERLSYIASGGFFGAALLNASKEIGMPAPAGEFIHWGPTFVLAFSGVLLLLQAVGSTLRK